MAAWWNDWLAALFEYDVMETVGIIGAVCQHLFGLYAPYEVASGSHVILLTGSEMEANRQPQCIDYRMDFATKSAAGTTESLGLRPPLFRRPPAA